LVLAGSVLLAVVLRTFHYPSVFRAGDVVLVQLDPWYYRIRVERVTERAQGLFDLAAFTDPGRDDLLVATLGWTAELFGGDATAVGTVLAVYPVVVAAVTCLLAALAGLWLSGDRRVGLAAAGTLAITPAHVYRTTLGFGDHHAFDYLWLAVTFVAVVYLARGIGRRRGRTVATVVLGGALAAQALSWLGGVLLLVPYSAFVLLVVLSALRAGESPASVGGPFVAGSGVASLVTAVAYLAASWQTETTVVLLLVQSATLGALVGVAELGVRFGRRPAVPAVGVLAGLVAALAFVRYGIPGVDGVVREGIAHFSRTSGRFAESTSIVGGTEPMRDVLSFFGLLVVPFVPYALVSTWRTIRTHRPGLLALLVYTWYFLVMSGIQRRFGGELALFFALVVGLAVGAFLCRFESGLGLRADGRRPGRDADDTDGSWTPDLGLLFAATLAGMVLVSVTVAQVPLAMESRTVSDAEYGAARRIEAHATERGWNRTDGYVFSSVPSNRMYNYYAHGEQVGFGYAKRRYPDFLASSDDRRWYRALERRGTGFVVLSDEYRVESDASLDAKLRRHLGSADGTTDGVGQYRLVYRSEDGAVTVYTLVRGALLSGVAAPNETVRVTTNVSTPDTAFTYERRPETTDRGRYGVIVPYAGTYRVAGQRVVVDEREVRNGETVGEQGPDGYWAFDGGRGPVLFDRNGRNHAVGRGLDWTDGVRNAAVSVDEGSRIRVRGESGLDASTGFTLSLWVRTQEGVDYRSAVRHPRLASTAPPSAYRRTSGYQLALAAGNVVGAVGNGTTATVLTGPAIDDGRWHHVALTWNGSVTRLFVDGRPYGTKSTQSEPTPDGPLVFGAAADFHASFVGDIDELRFRDEAAPPARVRAEFEAVADNRTAAGA
jgi:dolichyl-diphosphooligosaccharide--protein glycosyltransferase